MPKKKLKRIPLWRFFTDMPVLNKGLFGMLFASLAAASVVMVVAAENPARWSLEVHELTQSSENQVALRSYEHHYRSMQTEIGAWKEDTVYFATRITPQAWTVIAFAISQIIGWAFLLASASYVRSLLAYGVFLAFAVLIFVVNAGDSGDGAMSWLTNLGWAAFVLAPAYLLQQGIWRMKFAARVLVFLATAGLPFAWQLFRGGWHQLHTATAEIAIVLVVVTAVHLVFISSDISNLMFYLATNARNPRHRARFPLIFAVFLVVAAIEFIMLQKEMGWNLLPEGGSIALRPIHLVFLATMVSVGTKQNLAPVLKDHLPNLPMSHGFAALGLISISFIAYMASLGEYLFLHLIERSAIALFWITGLAHFFYIFYNFGPLIRARLHFYFLSMMPRRLMFFFVLATAIGGWVALEASSSAPSRRLLKEAIYNRLGDDALLHGREKEAMLQYQAAVNQARGSVKANYNLAMLDMAFSGDLDKAREHFRHAGDFIPFSYALLNWGNLERSEFSPGQALAVLRNAKHLPPNPYLFNNLAHAYMQAGQPDSAILQLKEALLLQPDNGSLYANLARIYMDNGKVEAARKFMEAGLALPKASRALVTNALYLNLAHGTRLNVKEELMQRPGIQGSWETTFNFALDRYQRGDYEGAQRLLSHGKPDLANGLDGTPAVMRPDSLLLDGMLLFERGEIERAISRMDFIDVNFPDYRPYTSHFLAVSFFAAGSPEMAAAFFRKSVASGRSSDLLPQAMMEFDRGDLDKAFTTLNLARSQDSTVFDAANLESAKVQLANGDYFFAAIGLDESTVTVADWMQIGVAAGKRGNKAAALEAFRHATVLDSKNTAPYLEMARISLSLGDSLAMENLQPGLDLAPGDVALNVALAQILIRDGNLAAASAIVQDVQARAPQDRDVRILGAAFAAASGDTATAIRQFERLRKEYPIDPGVVVSLSRIYRAKRMDFEGQNMTLAAIAINPENPDLWYEMAHFERLLSRPEEAGANALQAMKRAANPGRSEQIAAEFKEEISSFKAQHLGEEVGKNGR